MKLIITTLFTFLSFVTFCQNKVSGYIIDAQSNKPIQNAKVLLVGKSTEEIPADKKGRFKINDADTKDTLMFYADGYTSASIEVGSAKKMKIMLFSQNRNEHIDIGYGTQSAKSLTSSVTVLESSDFNRVLEADIYSYLRGKVPGLHIIQNASNPSNQPKIMLRGGGSLSGTYEPLIVIDGIQNASLSNLDPNDVASVTVLKDASAQAIYGTQANGGVLIIRTKRTKQ
ncbi:MAG: hypothetical protein RIR48_1691 [Bacteroidota bacterium]|jgi:TonB-dependent SusC/RagA subfamily outer membrane receptor